MRHNAIYLIHPEVVVINDDVGAFDKNGNLIEINVNAVTTKITELQAQAQAAEQAQATAKASALAKLAALGLTQAEISALIGA